MSRYRVMIDSHARYRDEEARYQHGAYATLEEALAVCRGIVDRSLEELRKPGISAAELFKLYSLYGDDPFIVPGSGDEPIDFSAWDYAKQQSKVLAAMRDSLGGKLKPDEEHHSR